MTTKELCITIMGTGTALAAISALLTFAFRRPGISIYDYSTWTLMWTPEVVVRGRAARLVQWLGWMAIILVVAGIVVALLFGRPAA